MIKKIKLFPVVMISIFEFLLIHAADIFQTLVTEDKSFTKETEKALKSARGHNGKN